MFDSSSHPLIPVAGFSFTMMDWLLMVLVAMLVMMIIVVIIGNRRRSVLDTQVAERARDAEIHMNELLKTQAEMQGRMQTMAEIFGRRQAELNQSIREQLTGMSNNLGQTINAQTKSTHENLAKLQERLAVIDTAQNNIQSLAGQVVQLQAILSNKQTRGAFGQGRMEAIISDGLPPNAYAFQATLSNGTRPDCLVFMPNHAPSLVIDAKFPLEAWNNMREAPTPQEKQAAERQFQTDMDTHIKAISGKYMIPGETQDTAFMFVPSESIFATIHEDFEGIVQKANRARVIIVSPSLLMLSIQVVQAIMKDARMREQAHLIQTEVGRLMEEVVRLDDRVKKLHSHFQSTSKDVEDILTTTGKIKNRGDRIEQLDLKEPAKTDTPPTKSAQQLGLDIQK
ncbi:DNA recombination protein RmuC [Bartonella sp. W8098]|uniref:DNA recombination protein RmuC n=1 Tax=Bartonella TaxID=773 RepID=UPI0018DEA43D|nr:MULTISPECIES: DNA recombination protein RmuC [Bartonella]MBH9986851.1 DNA recombination protein RmuC [Bartonella apis]MBI0171099.1 DNA recombination protein RmuC [Bartonella sp. W8151]